MKKLSTALMLVIAISTMSSAATQNAQITVTWEQAAEDYPKIASWTLKWSDSPSGPFVPVLNIDHPDTNPLSSAQGNITIVGNPGQTITKYFVLTAWCRCESGETGPSNVASATFKIPDSPLGVPSKLVIEVKLIPAQ